MDLRKFLLNNASLQSRPRRRRHSIADVRFLHTLHDIPEKPEEEDTAERRRSTGGFEKEKITRADSEPTGIQCYNEDNVKSAKEANDSSTVCPPLDHNIEESPRYKRSFSFERSSEEEEHLIEAVSTYVLSYTDDAGDVCNADDASPTTTGSSSPQESSKETSDEELALSEMLRKVDASMVLQRSRRGSMIDSEVVERITSLTPIVESSRSSSLASVSTNRNASPEGSENNVGSELSSRRSSAKNTDSNDDMLGKMSDILKSLSPQFDTTSDLGQQGTGGNDGKLSSAYPSPHMHGQTKDPWRPLSPANKGKTERDENPSIQPQAKVENQSKKESQNVLGKIMNSPNLLKRRGSLGDVLRTLSPHVGSSPYKVVDTEESSKSSAGKEREDDSRNNDKDGILERIIKSPSLTRRGSIGNILNTLSPNPVRKCPSPSPLTIKCDTDCAPPEKISPICPQGPKSKDVERPPTESRPKGLLAIVQQHVINHSQAMQRKRRNSIASAEPHTGTLEMSLRESLDTEEWGTKSYSVNDYKSPVVETTTSIKNSTSNNTKSNSDICNSSNNNNTESVNKKRCGTEDSAHNSNRPGAVLSHQMQDTTKASSPSDYSKSKEKFHTSVNDDFISPLTRKLVGSKSMDVPRVQSEQELVLDKSPHRKISAPLPPRGVNPPQRKSSVNVIKRSPITFVISNDKSGRTEGRGNTSGYQLPNGVSFTNSCFLPLSQQEADEFSRIKKAEASKPSMVNSTITMSSRVTVHGGSGSGVVRKLGTAPKQPPLSDSLPTEERFAALSERYANLKAKLGGSDNKQKTQDSSPKPDEERNYSPNTEDRLTQSKCWSTVESIPVQVYEKHVSDTRVDLKEAETETTLTAECGGKQGTHNEERSMNRMTITSSEESAVNWNNDVVINAITSTNGIETGPYIDANNNNSPSIAELQFENNGMGISSSTSHGKTSFDFRPESPAQRSMKSVVAKLMNRKMGPRRKQSIVPRVAKRRSKIYTENGIDYNGIPASVAQFEKIRTLVENTVLRTPVRQEALTIQQLLNGLSSCLTEAELVAICKECSKTLRTLDALGSLPSYVSLESVIINPSGTIKFKHLGTGLGAQATMTNLTAELETDAKRYLTSVNVNACRISIDDLFLAPEYSNKFASEKTCVFSLAATLWSAADWRLTEAEKPSLSPRFQELLVSMTDDAPDARPGLYDVLQTCESLQTEGDMTSRERCQALLWEYQASAAIENEDTTRKKTAQEDKKHHDTLMGSISVAASFKGFLKQTAKPQERNPFVKVQNNQEPSNYVDGKSSGEILTKKTTPKPEEEKAEQNTVAENLQKLKVISSHSSNADKEIPLSGSTNDKAVTANDANNNQDPAIERKRSYSLTEDQKEQLLSLLASAKLNKNPFYTGDNVHKSEESGKPVEEQPIKPPSPSLYAYPHYGQTDSQVMFSPITPAGRSASPSTHSDICDNQMPSLPNATYVPIAVPIPSVAPVPMPPFWYMPQGGMMPYPQQVMSSMPCVTNDASVTSNQSVLSTDSDVSEVSDMEPRPKKTSSPMPRFDKSEISKPDTEQSMRRSPAQQNNKGSKLPRPIWQTPVAKGRTTLVESDTKSSVVRRRVPITGEDNERREEVKPVRARTPSPSLGRRTPSKEVTPPRSQTPPVYWTKEGVDLPSNNKPRTRVSTGSSPNWRPSSPSSSLDGRRRSSSSPSRSTPNSPVQGRRSHSRPSSPAGSRSNSPVSMLVSKFEQMSQESSDNSPRVRSNSVSSMISKFGSSSLVPEERIVKGQFKPNPSASVPQPGSKTGPLRPSSNRGRASASLDHAPSPSWPGNPTSSRDRSRTSESSDDSKRSSISNAADPREVHRSGSDPGSADNRQTKISVESRHRLSSSHGNLDKDNESTPDECFGLRTRLLENIRKWTSQENIRRESSSSDARGKSVQERLASDLSLGDDYSTRKDKVDEKYSSKTRAERSPGKFSSTPSGTCSSSSDPRNDYVIKSNHASDNLSKPWQSKDDSSNDIARKSSLDSEPVREKGSPRSRPRNLCFTPEGDSSIQYCDVKSAKDFLWSPTSNPHKFEIPVDLAILEGTTPSVSSPLRSVGGFDLAYGGVDGNILSPTFPLSPGSLKDFKPSNYFTNVTFKCGEMEPERDTNCIPERPSRDSTQTVTSDTVTNRRDAKDNYVKRFERKILRSTGDIENEEPLQSSASGAVARKIIRSTGDIENEEPLLLSTSCVVKRLTCKDSKAVDSVSQSFLTLTGNPNSKKETTGNPSPVSSSYSTINSSPFLSTTQGSSAATLAKEDSQSPRTHSRTDQILRSRHPSGDSPSLKGSTSASRNPPSPMTLRKLISNPLPLDANTSQTRPSKTKRNSLPTSKPMNVLANHDPSNLPENRPLAKSSSQTNLSLSQKQVHKSSSHDNLSVRHTAAEDYSSNSLGKGFASGQRKDNGKFGKSNPHSKTVSTNNPYPKEDDIKTKSSKINTNPGNSYPSKERHGANEHSKERNPYSSIPHAKASRTTSAASKASESSPVRYPYTRRGSTPAKGSSTIKPPPKAASNPTSPLYPKQPKGHMEFFGAAGTTKELREIQHNPKSRQRFQSSGENSTTPLGAGKNDLANPVENVSKLSLSSVDNPEDSDVFFTPSSQESVSKSVPTSGKTCKRFPSSSSSDSGLNLSDPDETRKSNGNGSKSNQLRSPPTTPNGLSLSHSPSPTSPKFPIGTSIFNDPREQQNPLPSPDKGSNVVQKEPANVTFLSKSVQPDDTSNPFKTSSAKSDESPNETARNDSDKLRQPKGDVSKLTDKRSQDSSESTNSHAEKPPRDVPPAAKKAALASAGKLTSKEFVSALTPPPDISGKLSSKSPPSSSRVDSKELLGQLVKKVLNSAVAKQGPSPKASFAESANSATKEDGKGKSPQGKMFFLPDETIENHEREKTNCQGKNPMASSPKHKQRLSDPDKPSKGKEQGLLDAKENSPVGYREDTIAYVSPRSLPVANSETPISPSNALKGESSSSSPEVLSLPEEKSVLSKIIDMIHDEFAFDGYMDDGVEDVNMAEYVLSLAGMSEENFKEAITDQYSDLYWDEDLLHDMYEAVTGGEKIRRPTLQFSESTVSDISPPESISLSREESYLSLEPLYFNSVSRSSSERSGTGARDILVTPLGEATEFLPIKVIAPEMQADIQELLTPIFEDYHRVMGVKLASSVEDLTEKLGTKILEISQQLMLERRAKKKSMNSYNKMADVENKKDVKDLASKLVNDIEECDKKIIYLKNVQRQLRNVYAERFGLDTSLLYSFLVSYNKTCVSLVPELNNNFLNFSPIWNQRLNESTDIVDESLTGPSLQSGTKMGLFSYLFDRHAMSQAYVRYFLYTFRYIATAQELFTFIREKCSASLRTDSSGQVYNHQLQIRYRALDLLSEWIDGYYQFDFKTNPSLIKELLAFVKDELILVDRSERGHYLMELIAEKQKRDLNNNSSSDEPSDFVAVLQLEDPQGLGPVDGKKDSPRKPLGSRKSKSPVQCFRRTTPDKVTTYKPTLYLKALSVLDHSSRILAEQLTLIQQDLFFHIHPVHFLNSRAHGIGVGRTQSPTRERDSIFGFSTGSRRVSEHPGAVVGPVSWENNMYVSEPSTDGLLENLLEHAQDVSLWVAVEICSASSIKAQLALITKFVNAARYCCEIRNYSTCTQIIDALEMFVIRHLPVWKQVPTKTVETLEELKAVKVLLKTDSSWLMKSEASRDKPTIPCFLLFVIHVQQQELGGFTLPNDMYKWTKMRSAARLVDQIRLFKQMRYAFQTDDELKDRLKQRISECKKENLHALASENASNFHLSSSHGSRKFHDAFRKMKATFGGHN